MDNAGDVAARVLRGVASEVPAADLAPLLEELACVVLEDEAVRLAESVREGGEHAVRRAVELAELLLRRGLSTDETAEVSR